MLHNSTAEHGRTMNVAVLETQLQTEIGRDLPFRSGLDENSKLYEEQFTPKILELIVIA